MAQFLWELLLRAWRYTVSAMGTTTLAVFVSLISIPIILFILQLASEGFSRGGWRKVSTNRRADLSVALMTTVAWGLVFGYKLFVSVPRDIRGEVGERAPTPISTKLVPPTFAYQKTKYDPVWGYAFMFQVYPWEEKAHLGVATHARGNLHNVYVGVQEIEPGNLGSGKANMQRDLDMFKMRSTNLAIVRSGGELDSGLLYDYGQLRKFEIAVAPENGDEITEELHFAKHFQCIRNVTRMRDKKILMEKVEPPFDEWGREIKGRPLQKCGF